MEVCERAVVAGRRRGLVYDRLLFDYNWMLLLSHYFTLLALNDNISLVDRCTIIVHALPSLCLLCRCLSMLQKPFPQVTFSLRHCERDF